MLNFALGDIVSIIVSGERGLIVGHARYIASEDQYFLRYKAADGRAVEQWWNASALTSVELKIGANA